MPAEQLNEVAFSAPSITSSFPDYQQSSENALRLSQAAKSKAQSSIKEAQLPTWSDGK